MPRAYSFVAVAFAAVACGGAVTLDDGSGGSSGGAGVISTGGRAGSGGSGALPGTGGTGAGGSGGTAQDAGFDVFVDPGCPDVVVPPPVSECDPFNTPSGCRFDEGCYPFVEYPGGECATEQYGSRCLPAGTGTQGSDCEEARCAPGFVCVVGAAPGSRCVQLCPVFGDDLCPAGMVCEPIDIQQGFGGCL
jgi:hypothetical protein